MQKKTVRQKTVRPTVTAEPLETRRLFTTFTVSNLNPDGAGSLADAVSQSNDNPGADVIEFGASVIGSIPLSDNLEVTDSLEVNGPGASALTLIAGGGEGTSRVFDITADDTSTKVTIAGLTLTGGDYDFGGSAVNNFAADVTIDSCVITNNFAVASDGGAIVSAGAARSRSSTQRSPTIPAAAKGAVARSARRTERSTSATPPSPATRRSARSGAAARST